VSRRLLCPLRACGLQRFHGFLMALREVNNKSDGVWDELLPNTTLRLAARDSKRDTGAAFFGALVRRPLRLCVRPCFDWELLGIVCSCHEILRAQRLRVAPLRPRLRRRRRARLRRRGVLRPDHAGVHTLGFNQRFPQNLTYMKPGRWIGSFWLSITYESSAPTTQAATISTEFATPQISYSSTSAGAHAH
jgi:hypothetical protein